MALAVTVMVGAALARLLAPLLRRTFRASPIILHESLISLAQCSRRMLRRNQRRLCFPVWPNSILRLHRRLGYAWPPRLHCCERCERLRVAGRYVSVFAMPAIDYVIFWNCGMSDAMGLWQRRFSMMWEVGGLARRPKRMFNATSQREFA